MAGAFFLLARLEGGEAEWYRAFYRLSLLIPERDWNSIVPLSIFRKASVSKLIATQGKPS